jgi:hypothetical protein
MVDNDNDNSNRSSRHPFGTRDTYYESPPPQQEQQQKEQQKFAWARIRKRSSTEALELAQQTSTNTSEYRLRMESIKWWQQHIQTAHWLAWKQLVTPILEECYEFFKCDTINNYNNNKGTNEDNHQTSDDMEKESAHAFDHANDSPEEWWTQFCLPLSLPQVIINESGSSSCNHPFPQQHSLTQLQYPPETLPIVIIASPLSNSCLMDRQFLATTIWKEWNSNNKNNSNNNLDTSHDLCLLLPRLLPTLTDTLHLLSDALTTTLMESSRKYYYDCCAHLLIHHGRKKRKRTRQSSIQEWICDVLHALQRPPPPQQQEPQVLSLDDNIHPRMVNLVIVLQDDLAGSTIVKRQFLQLLTSWRSLQGIPVALVILSSSSSSSSSCLGAGSSLSALVQCGEDGSSGRFGRRVSYKTIPSSSATTNNSVFAVSHHPHVVPSCADAIALWSYYFLEALQETPVPLFPSSSSSSPSSHFPNTTNLPMYHYYHWIQESLLESISCTRLVDRLRGLVSQFFAHPGSFVWDSLRPNTTTTTTTPTCFSNKNESYLAHIAANPFQPLFCAWFCVYEKAQTLLSPSMTSENKKDKNDPTTTTTTTTTAFSTCDKYWALLQCRQLLNPGGILFCWWKISCVLSPLHIWVTITEQEQQQTITPTATMTQYTDPSTCHCNFFLTCLRQALALLLEQVSTIETMTNFMEEDDVTRLLARYLQRQASTDKSTNHQKEESICHIDDFQWKDVARIVKELIVLMDNIGSSERIESTDKDTPNWQVIIWKGLRQMMLEVNQLTNDNLEYWTRVWIHTNPLMKWMDMDQPVRTVQYQAMIPIPRYLNLRRNMVAGLSPTVRRLVHAMQDQMTIMQEDWFRAFDGTIEEFCLGVWTLQMMGLIQTKKGGRTGGTTSKVVYEKVSVVWGC